MFNQISWAYYTQIVAFILIAYYLFILYKYYRYDLLRFLKKKHNVSNQKLAFTSADQGSDLFEKGTVVHPNNMQTEESNEDCYPYVQTLSDEVQAFIIEAGNNSFDKEQLVPSIQLLLSKYPSVKSSPNNKDIRNLIKKECETNCSVYLSESELDGLWIQ